MKKPFFWMKQLMRLLAIPLSPKVRGKRLVIAIRLMELLAIPLSNQKTIAKWLVISCQRPQLSRWLSRFFASLESKHEVAIMYFGRASEFLLMTSERMAIPDEGYTLAQMLNSLRKRDARWAYELDDRHVVCTVNGKAMRPFDTIRPGVEINIYSRKSIFEL